MAELLSALTPAWWASVASILDDHDEVSDADLVVHEREPSGRSHHLLWAGGTLRAWRPGPPARHPDLELLRPARAAVGDLLARTPSAETMAATTVRLRDDGRDRDVLGLPCDPVWPWPEASGHWRIRWHVRCPDTPFGRIEATLEVGPPDGVRPAPADLGPPDVAFTLQYDDLLAWTSGRTFLGPVLDLSTAVGDVALLSAVEGTVGGEARQLGGEPMPDVLPLVRYRAARNSPQTGLAFDAVDAFTA